MRGELRGHDADAQADAQRDVEIVDTALAAFGLVAERGAVAVAQAEPYYLRPELAPAFELWTQLQTQWRVGMAGPTGLDYCGVEALMRMQGLRPKVQRERLWQIQAMERAALDFWAENK